MQHRVKFSGSGPGQDIEDWIEEPFEAESILDDDLVLYYETDSGRQEYLDISAEDPFDHQVILDNPSDELIDEG